MGRSQFQEFEEEQTQESHTGAIGATGDYAGTGETTGDYATGAGGTIGDYATGAIGTTGDQAAGTIGFESGQQSTGQSGGKQYQEDNSMAVEYFPIIMETVKTAGSLATIATFVRSWLKPSKIDVTEAERKEALEASHNVKAEPSPELLNILSRISQQILSPILDRIKKAEDTYRLIIANGTLFEIKQAHDFTSKDVCALLKLILKHNEGVMPEDEYLRELWSNFSCKTVPTIFD